MRNFEERNEEDKFRYDRNQRNEWSEKNYFWLREFRIIPDGKK